MGQEVCEDDKFNSEVFKDMAMTRQADSVKPEID